MSASPLAVPRPGPKHALRHEAAATLVSFNVRWIMSGRCATAVAAVRRADTAATAVAHRPDILCRTVSQAVHDPSARPWLLSLIVSRHEALMTRSELLQFM